MTMECYDTNEPQEGVVYKNVEWIKTETGWRMIQNEPRGYKNILTQLYDGELVEVWHYEDCEGFLHDLLTPENCLRIKFNKQVEDEYNKKFLNLVNETQEMIKKHVNRKTFLIRDALYKNQTVIEQKQTYSAIRSELQEDTNLGSKIGQSISKYNEFLCLINKIVKPLKKDRIKINKLIEIQKNYKAVKIVPPLEPEPDNSCPICYEDIKKTPKWLIKCSTCKNILYHLSCISKHWETNKTCPICRREHNTKNKDYIFVHKDNVLKYINVKQDDFIEE